MTGSSTTSRIAHYLLSLDPSSACIGYAYFDEQTAVLIEAGRITPAKRDAPANDRIHSLIDQLEDLMRQRTPASVVFEDSSGKVIARHRGGGAGLAVHGKAVGAVMIATERFVGRARVTAVPENVWTRGRPKPARAALVASQHRGYTVKSDPGLDMADAIGLGDWMLIETRLGGSARVLDLIRARSRRRVGARRRSLPAARRSKACGRPSPGGDAAGFVRSD